MSLKIDFIDDHGWEETHSHTFPDDFDVLIKGDRRIALKYEDDGTIQARGYAVTKDSLGWGVYLGTALVDRNSDTSEMIQDFVVHGKIKYTDILLKNIDFVVKDNDTLDRYLSGLKRSEKFPGCYHYVDTSGGYRKCIDRVVIYPDMEDCGYQFLVNPDGSMYVVKFDVEEGLIMKKNDMVNINSNLLSDLLHHVFSSKKIYA